MLLLRVILILFLSTLIDANDEVQERPVIAVLAQYNTDKSEQYVAASYVKWLESMGARTIPLLHDADDSVVDSIFQQVNGVLLPGGSDQDITRGIKRLWDLAVDANLNGDRFPVFGTCLGFEYMVAMASEGGKNILESNYDAENISLPLIFTEDVLSSQLFSDAHIQQIAATQNVTMNNHQRGITPNSFTSDSLLSSMFKIISTNTDRQGKPFVSTIEANDLALFPFYGVQWHPEKNNFEYGLVANTNIPYEKINHSADAIDVSIEMSRIFVNEARKNKHVYTNVNDFPLIWKYDIVNGIEFEQRFVIARYDKPKTLQHNLRNVTKSIKK